MALNLVVLYIDPGTGSILISTIIGVTLTALFSLKGFFYKSLARLSGKAIKRNNDFSEKLVLFSEGKNYSRVFSPVVDELITEEMPFIYLTSDKDDPILRTQSPLCESHYIGQIKQAIIFMNTLKAKMCVTTTPQLNILTFKRSKEVKHYCHLIHSPTDIHAYKKFAFDYFDSVLCSSQFQMSNLRQLETDRKSHRKELYETGCTYLDLTSNSEIHKGDSVLLAPTWGDKSFFSSCGLEMINYLLLGGYKIIYRPHPQSWISDRALLKLVLDRFEKHPKFSIDKDVDNSNSIAKSQIMICDISGVIYDYVFSQRKPVIAVDFAWNDGGYESSDINAPTSTSLLLAEVGQFIKPEEVSNICSTVERVMKIKISNEVINKHIFNYKKATPVATSQILDIYNNLSQ